MIIHSEAFLIRLHGWRLAAFNHDRVLVQLMIVSYQILNLINHFPIVHRIKHIKNHNIVIPISKCTNPVHHITVDQVKIYSIHRSIRCVMLINLVIHLWFHHHSMVRCETIQILFIHRNIRVHYVDHSMLSMISVICNKIFQQIDRINLTTNNHDNNNNSRRRSIEQHMKLNISLNNNNSRAIPIRILSIQTNLVHRQIAIKQREAIFVSTFFFRFLHIYIRLVSISSFKKNAT